MWETTRLSLSFALGVERISDYLVSSILCYWSWFADTASTLDATLSFLSMITAGSHASREESVRRCSKAPSDSVPNGCRTRLHPGQMRDIQAAGAKMQSYLNKRWMFPDGKLIDARKWKENECHQPSAPVPGRHLSTSGSILHAKK